MCSTKQYPTLTFCLNIFRVILTQKSRNIVKIEHWENNVFVQKVTNLSRKCCFVSKRWMFKFYRSSIGWMILPGIFMHGWIWNVYFWLIKIQSLKKNWCCFHCQFLLLFTSCLPGLQQNKRKATVRLDFCRVTQRNLHAWAQHVRGRVFIRAVSRHLTRRFEPCAFSE